MKDRIVLLLVQMLGFIMSKLPFFLLEKMTEFLGLVLMTVPSSRRRLLLSNLRHAFPDWEYAKILSVARKSSARMFEMGFFSLCYPFMSKEQLRHTVFYDDDTEAKLEELRRTGKPVLILIPHTCLFETLATSPFFRPLGNRCLGAIYRPNKNRYLDEWITKARCNVGLTPFSRKEGLIKARSHLKKGNWLAILYDQNAGHQGTGHIFMNRICSITPLPDLYLRNNSVICVHAIAKRVSFFRSSLQLDVIECGIEKASCLGHQVLAETIKQDKNGLSEWLWHHGKWKINNEPRKSFQLLNLFDHLTFQQPNKSGTSIWIRLPNWLGDIVMAIPLVKAIQNSRPDANVTLICHRQYKDFLKHLGIGLEIIELPVKGFTYFFKFWNLRKIFPDIYFVFTNSLRGDFEAFLCGAPLRLGLCGRWKRPFLTHESSREINHNHIHQTKLWQHCLEYFGLQIPIDLNQVVINRSKNTQSNRLVALAPGSSNSPEKRWCVENWISLLLNLMKQLPGKEFVLIGSHKDSIICRHITNKVNSSNLQDLSGKTKITELCNIFYRSDVLVCNDSGAMHLANFIGVPVYAVFSTTNPIKTGPIFNSPSNLYGTNQIELLTTDLVSLLK